MAPAEADFVTLCDQDDRWHPDKLERLLGGIGERPARLQRRADRQPGGRARPPLLLDRAAQQLHELRLAAARQLRHRSGLALPARSARRRAALPAAARQGLPRPLARGGRDGPRRDRLHRRAALRLRPARRRRDRPPRRQQAAAADPPAPDRAPPQSDRGLARRLLLRLAPAAALLRGPAPALLGADDARRSGGRCGGCSWRTAGSPGSPGCSAAGRGGSGATTRRSTASSSTPTRCCAAGRSRSTPPGAADRAGCCPATPSIPPGNRPRSTSVATMNGGGLDVVIVSYRSRELLRAASTSLRAHPPSAPMKVMVVDNASGDGTIEMVAADYPGGRPDRLAENLGFAAATNLGARRGQLAVPARPQPGHRRDRRRPRHGARRARVASRGGGGRAAAGARRRLARPRRQALLPHPAERARATSAGVGRRPGARGAARRLPGARRSSPARSTPSTAHSC